MTTTTTKKKHRTAHMNWNRWIELTDEIRGMKKEKKTISTSESVNGRRWNRNKEYRWEQNRHLPKSLWSRSLLRETNDNGSLCPSPLGLSSSSSRSPSWRSFLLLSKFCDSNNFNCCWCNRFLIKNIFGILSSVLFLLMCSKRYFLFDQVFVIDLFYCW